MYELARPAIYSYSIQRGTPHVNLRQKRASLFNSQILVVALIGIFGGLKPKMCVHFSKDWRSDFRFLCPSQLLPFFSLYSLLMARLWRFGFLFCSSVSSQVSRASVLRRRHCHLLRSSLAWFSLIGVPFLRGLSFSRSPLLFRLVTPSCFMDYVIAVSCCLMDHWICIGIAQERDPEEGRTVTNAGLALCVVF